MENHHASSSSNSSSPNPHENPKTVSEIVEDEERMDNLEPESPQNVLSERTIVESPSNNLDILQTEREPKKKQSARDDREYICKYCDRIYTCPHALGGHQSTHKKERALEKILTKMEPSRSPRLSFTKLLFGECSQGALRIRKQHGTSLNPLKPVGGGHDNENITSVIPSFISRLNGGITGTNMIVNGPVTPDSLSTDDDRLKLSLGPYKPKEDKINNNSYPLFSGAAKRRITDVNAIYVPSKRPWRYFIKETNNGSVIRDSLASNNTNSHGLSNDTQDVKFSFGPFKYTGPVVGSNGNNTDSSTNDGVTRETPLVNTTLVRHVASYPLVIGNTTCNGSSSRNPFPTSKGKNKILEPEDDEDDDTENEAIEDHKVMQLEETEAKSWGRDLSLSL